MQLPSTHPGIKSKNPIAGYMVCACESVATLHHFRGDDRQGLYSNCPKCGTSVSKAAEYQARLKAALVSELEQLPTSVLTPLSGNEPRTEPREVGDVEAPHLDALEANKISETSGTEPRTTPRMVAEPETPALEVNETNETSGTDTGNTPRFTTAAKWLLGFGLLAFAAIGGRAAYIKSKG